MRHIFIAVFRTTVFSILLLPRHYYSFHPTSTSSSTLSTSSSYSTFLTMAQETTTTVADESSTNLNPWLERWTDKRIGFHLSEVNPVIEKYGKQFLVNVSPTTTTTKEGEDGTTSVAPTCSTDNNNNNNNNTRVFVPLCGKTVDMAYLATTTYTSEVVGVEGIRLALEEFATEHPSLNVKSDTTTIVDGFERFVGDKVLLLKGDYFDLDPTKTDGTFGLIYDRASLVAIDPSLRPAYVDVQGKLLARGGKILLVVLERKGPEDAMKRGPPFSLSESTVRNLYEHQDWVQSIELLEQSDQLVTKPEDKERYPDLDQLLETVYCIQTKG